MPSKIEWTDETWNPVTGCTKVSQGCKHCYAEGVARRFWGDRKFTDVQTHPDRLDQPLRWRKPRRVFVNSMSDLFHDDVPDKFIDQVFAIMALAKEHTFQVLTKRPARMLAYLRQVQDVEKDMNRWACAAPETYPCAAFAIEDCDWPLPNVWLGVSVEDQATADERIPLLLQMPAALRFVSYEPALGPVNLWPWLNDPETYSAGGGFIAGDGDWKGPSPIGWIIVGGESGPKARPFDVAWAAQTVGQCKDAGVPCFVKQLGAQPITNNDHPISGGMDWELGRIPLKHPKGADPSEWPADLRVQQYPETEKSP